MRRTPWSLKRGTVLLVLALATVASAALGAMLSFWFAAPLPLLIAATYAAYVGMTPARFLDALDDPGSGAGTHAPF